MKISERLIWAGVICCTFGIAISFYLKAPTQTESPPEPIVDATPLASSAVGAPAPSSTPVASAGPPVAPSAEPIEEWTRIHSDDWGLIMVYDWEGLGGETIQIWKGRPGSKTPWNILFQHNDASSHRQKAPLAVGCGFYESSKAFCRSASKTRKDDKKFRPKNHKTIIEFKKHRTDQKRLRIAVAGWFSVEAAAKK